MNNNKFKDHFNLGLPLSTFIKWNNVRSHSGTLVDCNNSEINQYIVKAVNAIDVVHDDLAGVKSKPGPWEDDIFQGTAVNEGGEHQEPICNILSKYGKCVIIQPDSGLSGSDVSISTASPNSRTNDTEGQSPYRIPDQNVNCFIKDCFPGASVPGLNNLLDQSAASLKTFFKESEFTHGKNPIHPDSPGGIGEQYEGNSLQHTAYFNYDIFMYKYIKSEHHLDGYKFRSLPSDDDDSDDDDVLGLGNEDSQDSNDDPDNVFGFTQTNDTSNITYTQDLIYLINTVNLNYLWAHLMIFCYECVKNDNYLNQTGQVATYNQAIKRLQQIRFDGFSTNQDGFIMNPIFSYRGKSVSNDLTYINQDQVNEIDTMINDIYREYYGDGNDMNGIINDTNLGGSKDYVTTQAMAATCIIRHKGNDGIVCRNVDFDDSVKNSCMRELSALFASDGGNDDIIAASWRIIKFSGDSSHVVQGQILENMQDNMEEEDKFKVIYLVSERPLAARLISAKKTVMVLSTNVIAKYFNGPGSEDISKKRAALFVQFDQKIAISNMKKSIIEKIENIINFPENYRFSKQGLASDIQTPDALLNSLLPETNTTDFNDITNFNRLSDILKTESIKRLFTFFEIDTLANNINNAIVNMRAPFISTKSPRITKLPWLSLINSINKGQATSYEPTKIVIRNYLLLHNLIDTVLNDTALNPELINQIRREYINDIKSILGTTIDKIIQIYTSNGEPVEKYMSFVIHLREEYLATTKGDGDRIPGKIELIINDLKEMIDNIIDFNEKDRITPSNTGGNNRVKGTRSRSRPPNLNNSTKKKRTGRIDMREWYSNKQNTRRAEELNVRRKIYLVECTKEIKLYLANLNPFQEYKSEEIKKELFTIIKNYKNELTEQNFTNELNSLLYDSSKMEIIYEKLIFQAYNENDVNVIIQFYTSLFNANFDITTFVKGKIDEIISIIHKGSEKLDQIQVNYLSNVSSSAQKKNFSKAIIAYLPVTLINSKDPNSITKLFEKIKAIFDKIPPAVEITTELERNKNISNLIAWKQKYDDIVASADGVLLRKNIFKVSTNQESKTRIQLLFQRIFSSADYTLTRLRRGGKKKRTKRKIIKIKKKQTKNKRNKIKKNHEK